MMLAPMRMTNTSDPTTMPAIAPADSLPSGPAVAHMSLISSVTDILLSS